MNARLDIRYVFTFDDGREVFFDVRLDRRSLLRLDPTPAPLPAWTALTAHQCPHCPLDPGDHPHCPLAVQLVEAVQRFDRLDSYTPLRLDVHTEERTVSQHTTAQQGVSSLLGLLTVTSGCPHTAWLRPLARFHLPLASEEETVYRTISTFLLAKHFSSESGEDPECSLEGLQQLNADLQTLNQAVAARLREATGGDSLVNALVRLDVNTKRAVVQKCLSRIQPLFTAQAGAEAD